MLVPLRTVLQRCDGTAFQTERRGFDPGSRECRPGSTQRRLPGRYFAVALASFDGGPSKGFTAVTM